MKDCLLAVLRRDLETVRRTLEAYPDEADLWKGLPGVNNCAGTLALHLAGNLRHFIGAQLGGSGYVRDRDAEFRDRDVPRAELSERLILAEMEVTAAFGAMDEDALDRPWPGGILGMPVRTGDFLLHLCGHLTYHLGQMDFHRRVVTGNNESILALTIDELHTAKQA
ncbi:MAG: DinB family protein [Gemmatimonadetes bacterium]|nr:DinB family protein [Gemmatimonadota bacterium]